ncbi:MAG: RHH-type transcriptional regulator, proline utilization regulon repressor / proline dehydrogenase [Thermodesulfobacteriota bacterium]|nr:RHH-type transcriptional regulator, proline utilization regulon repressor / proline dehydrogenase [Thermodesulfobacteriota bacterium]
MGEELEKKITRVGQEIFSLVGGDVPSLFDRKSWNGRLTEWAMKDEALRIQLFRLVDVLPCLKTDALVVRMLKEYFADVGDNPLFHGIGRISGILPHIAAGAVRTGVESLAAQFIGGRDERDCLQVLQKLRHEGIAFTVDLLGEEVLSEKEAQRFAQRYKRLLGFLDSAIRQWPIFHILDHDDQGSIPRLDVSLKVSSFYSQLEPRNWAESILNATVRLSPLVKLAGQMGASITFDMEHYYFKDLIISVFTKLLEEHTEWQFAGIVLQAYLHETKENLLGLIEWAKEHKRRLTVRLVKGAYWDYETVTNRQKGWPVPVFLQKEETDLNYEELTRIMLGNTPYVRPAIATHNIRSISHAIGVADSLKLPKEALEFQMIYGMAEPVRAALKKMNYRVRAYTPIGDLIPGMAYLIRRLLENTSNESFLRKSFSEQTPPAELMKAPRPMRTSEAYDLSPTAFLNEPLIDFSRSENRSQMEKALQKARNGFGKRYPVVIGSKEVWTDLDNPSFNPATPDEVIGRVCIASRHMAQEAVDSARLAWPMWKSTPAEERARYLFRAAEEMRRRRFELMALEVYEVGKTWPEADGDVAEAIDFLEYYGREMIRLNTPKVLGNYPGEANEYLYEGRGLGVVISPWNFPLAIPTGMVSAGIVSGNCVILKPSGLSPVLAWNLFEIFRSVGLPSGVLQFVSGSGQEIGEYLVSHPGIDFIAFTGSREVGLKIVRLAAETSNGQANVKRVIAEMGGKNAIIVDETADLDEAVKGVLESALSFQGQKCSACSRVIVVGGAFAEFCDRLREAMEEVIVGAPEDPGVFMGPVIDEAAMTRIQAHIELGNKEGKAILIRKTQGEGYFVGPAIFTDVNPNSRIAQEEIFGPVLVIMEAQDLDGAIAIANCTLYALTGGIFSRSPGNIRKAKSDFNVGNLYINRKITGASVGRQPFGGFGMSGMGSKAGGPDYLLQFMHARSVSENTLRRGFAPQRPKAL